MSVYYNSTHTGAQLDGAITKVTSSSGSWDAASTDLASKSGSWEDAATDLASKSGSWDSAASDLASKSGSWENIAAGTSSVDLLLNTQSIIQNPDSLVDGAYLGIVHNKTAGESMVFGELGYIKSDGKVWKANAVSAVAMPALYLAVDTIAGDAVGAFLRKGTAKTGSWSFTTGEFLYVESGSTDGVVTNVTASDTGANVQILGIATDTDTIEFDPSLVVVKLS